jgi:hypothetical protein
MGRRSLVQPYLTSSAFASPFDVVVPHLNDVEHFGFVFIILERFDFQHRFIEVGNGRQIVKRKAL